jgi:uncharacterized protein YunC (DUF1805 family)
MENIINLLKTSPRGEKMFAMADKISVQVLDGHEDALQLLVGIKAMQKMFDAIIERIEESALNEALLEAKRFEKFGAKIEVREVGARYNFENCQDPVLVRISEQKKQWSDLEKDRQNLLKTLRGKTELLDTETGEIINALPPIKTSKTGVVVTL